MTGKTFVTASAALAMGFAVLGASAAMAGQAEGVAGGKSAKDPNRKVCRNLVISGSRLSTRSCRTQGEWDKAAHDAQESALQQQTGPGGRPENMRSDQAAAIAGRPQ